ncbi:MAG: T9SS type A sorting domain-containing protein, partial [bacterium]
GKGYGVWRVGEEVPETFGLSSVYPNPFNGELVVEYGVRRGERYRVGVYDVGGREVGRIGEGLGVGVRERRVWRASETLASGVYFVRLHTSSQTSIAKIALLR